MFQNNSVVLNIFLAAVLLDLRKNLCIFKDPELFMFLQRPSMDQNFVRAYIKICRVDLGRLFGKGIYSTWRKFIVFWLADGHWINSHIP